MKLSDRSATIYLLISYALLSSIPLLTLMHSKSLEDAGVIFAFECASWLCLWSVFQKPRWFHYLLLPAFFALPIECYLRLYFQQGISPHHLGIIIETSPKEAIEFLGNKVWLLLLVILSVIFWWRSTFAAAKQSVCLEWRHGSRWIILFVILIGSAFWWYGKAFGVASASSSSVSIGDAKVTTWSVQGLRAKLTSPFILPTWAAPFFDEEIFSRSWPLGNYVHGVNFYVERQTLSELSQKNRNFTFKAAQLAGNDFPQTLVIVIGESSRYDRWGINGYGRDTNPLLKQEKNIVSFSNMISAVAATRLAVPIIMSRKSATQSLKAGFSEKSFISAFNEAGFKTFWLSNQMSFGQFDTPTSVIAKEADVTQFFNLGGFTNGSSLDAVLLDPVNAALNDSAPNKLIVLHTLGNHWNYSHRHPKDFDQWKPSLFGVANPAYTDLKNKEALNNSYDNSILYTDWMLAQVITQLKQRNQLTALVYVSDHGQTLYDGTCQLAFHGHNTQFEFHIPAFVWYSDQYQSQHPHKVEQLLHHRNAKLSTENIFHSVLDMMDIRYPNDRVEWSIFSPSLKNHTRYVDSYGWTNYDDAHLQGDCREVIDNKTPVTQEK